MKRTKILATVGPASQDFETICNLLKQGVNGFRLNFSHGSHDYHLQTLNTIRDAIKSTGITAAILQDISGPKIRVANLDEPFHLDIGDKLDLYAEDIIGSNITPNHYKASINQPQILKMLKSGDHIYLCDGAIKAIVTHNDDEKVSIETLNKGILSSKKGINFPNTRLGIDVLTPKDRADMAWGVQNGVDYMAISFVQSAQDMIQAREIITSLGGDTALIAKIEKFDAVENIDEILQNSDGIMVARGDLGIEVPYHDVPLIQKMLIRKANEASKPVITATQMLLSMTQNESATRAEISDVANAVLDGTDAVMLSEESAVGHNPVLVVKTMVETIKSAETIYPFDKFEQFNQHDAMDFVDESAVRLGDALDANGIIVMTSSGTSARKIARYRPKMTIFASVHDEKIARKLSLVWGVSPAFFTKKAELDEMMSGIVSKGLQMKILNKKETYIFTAGDPVGVQGTTNLIRILRENEMLFFDKRARVRELAL